MRNSGAGTFAGMEQVPLLPDGIAARNERGDSANFGRTDQRATIARPGIGGCTTPALAKRYAGVATFQRGGMKYCHKG